MEVDSPIPWCLLVVFRLRLQFHQCASQVHTVFVLNGTPVVIGLSVVGINKELETIASGTATKEGEEGNKLFVLLIGIVAI